MIVPKLKYLSDDQLQISQNNPWYLRALGVPTLLVGLYIAYHLVAGLLHYVAHRASLSEWFEAIPALLLFALIAALFLLPSLYWMLAFSQRTFIDRKVGTVRRQSGAWPFRQVEECGLGEVSGIELRSEESKTTTINSGNRTTQSTLLETVRLLRRDSDQAIDVSTYTAGERESLNQLVSELSSWLGLEVSET